jgi:hypothetical protein
VEAKSRLVGRLHLNLFGGGKDVADSIHSVILRGAVLDIGSSLYFSSVGLEKRGGAAGSADGKCFQ